METEKTAPLVVETTYNAPVGKVWQAITDNAKMKQWYFDIAAFEPVVGFEFEFYGENEGVKFRHLCKVTAVKNEKKLAYSWRYDGYPGNSVVTFELLADGDKTKIILTHEGLETFPDLKDFRRENFAAGWNEIIGNILREYVE